jgi:hypothetical protein
MPEPNIYIYIFHYSWVETMLQGAGGVPQILFTQNLIFLCDYKPHATLQELLLGDKTHQEREEKKRR